MMKKKKIKIITDSVADIPPDLLEKWDIGIIPTYVNLDGESFADDGNELDRSYFYNNLENFRELPTTAAPPPAIAEEILQTALESYDHIICIHVASTLSVTYNNVRLGAQALPKGTVTVVDSESVTMGIGWQALLAAEVAAETGDVNAVLRAIEGVKKNHRLYAAIYTMEFLRRSGRVSNLIASIGSILKIKPIITVKEMGAVEAEHRVRTFSRATGKLADLLKEEKPIDRLAIIYTRNRDAAEDFMDSHKELMPAGTFITEVGPTLGTHIGPDSLGYVAVYKGWR